MTKELEAFYKIKDKLIKVEGNTTYGSITDLTNLDIIEAALRDYAIEHNLRIRLERALETIKECFNLNGFDELIPNENWWENEDKQKIVKEVLKND